MTTLIDLEGKDGRLAVDAARAFHWPNRARAAVSLTYDDGLDNHLEVAMPQLEAVGVRGTFYLIPGDQRVRDRSAEWRAAFERGHEIGNHTWSHPGPGVNHTLPLESHTPTTIAEEVQRAARWLDQQVGLDTQRTFAYPYACTSIGEPPDDEPYNTAILGCHLGARLGGGNAPLDPKTLDPVRCHSWPSGNELPASVYIERCQSALRSKGWSILTFHGVGGPWLETKAAEHRRLLDWLSSQPIWVAPMRDVLSYILKER